MQQFCTLPDEIHPILAPQNWAREDFRKDAVLWQNLQPTLHFATQMLLDDAALLWWTQSPLWSIDPSTRKILVVAREDRAILEPCFPECD